MSDHYGTPLTPPRLSLHKVGSSSPNKSPSSLKTPSTPRKREWLLTPYTASRKKLRRLENDSLHGLLSEENITRGSGSKNKVFPLTPTITPRRTPLKSKPATSDLLDKQIGAIDSLLAENGNSQFGIFLPTPSTVGTGRRFNIPAPKLHAKLSPDILDTPSSRSNIFFEEDAVEEPQTPSFQMINDSLVKHWHNKSFNNSYSSDDELEISEVEKIKREEPVNPFIGGSSSSSSIKKANSHNPFDSSSTKDSAHLDTHVEFINHTTGERKLVELSPNQRRIKPKKLDFSKAIND